MYLNLWTKLHLEIFRVENELEIVAKSNQPFSLGGTDQSMSNKSQCHQRKE